MLPVITALLPLLGSVLDKVIPDPAEREKAMAELHQQAHQLSLGQMEVNKVEAAHASLFVAGWRPWIGWVCGAGLAWTFLLAPLLGWLVALFSPTIVLPALPTDHLMELVFAMLGLGGLRTVEKIKGAAR